jgi:hypothetical protein
MNQYVGNIQMNFLACQKNRNENNVASSKSPVISIKTLLQTLKLISLLKNVI